MGTEEIIYSIRDGADYMPALEVRATQPSVQVGFLLFDQDTGVRDWDNSLYLHLDRDGVNRMIRALRKQRDKVFGSDE